MDPQVLEARYHRAVFRGSEETLARDFMLRYGASWRDMWKASEGASEADVEAAEKNADLLAKLVESRIDDVETAAIYAAYGRNLSLEKELELGLELLGRPGSLERLLRWGLVIHFDDEVAAAPPYLAKLLIALASRAPHAGLNLVEEMEVGDGAAMAFLEGLLTGEFDEELHRLFYGDPPAELRVGRLAMYRSGVGLVVNPAASQDELLEALLQIKERRAETLARALSLHGEYEFSREHRCGLQYLSVDGTAEKSGVVAVCPWLSYSRRLWRMHNLVVVVEGRRPAEPPRVRTGVVFVKGGEAEVVKPTPPPKFLEYVVDVLYSVGFSVSEVEL